MKLIGNLIEPADEDEQERVMKMLSTNKRQRTAEQVLWCAEAIGVENWLRLRGYYLNGTLRMGKLEGTFGT